jgi:hypothetical protein
MKKYSSLSSEAYDKFKIQSRLDFMSKTVIYNPSFNKDGFRSPSDLFYFDNGGLKPTRVAHICNFKSYIEIILWRGFLCGIAIKYK